MRTVFWLENLKERDCLEDVGVDEMDRDGGVKLATYPHLVPRSRTRGSAPPLSKYVFMAWCLVKHRDNFTFTLP
jgi:hypothetical protein